MNKGNIEIASVASLPRKDGFDGSICLNWQDSPAIQALLDVVVEIMAEEYVQVARENKDVFTEIAAPASPARKDGGGTI